jgi:uncharacterized membrane protein
MNLSKLKKPSLFLMAFLYLLAGVNHFLSPESYLPIIPDYLPSHDLINILAGIAEIILGFGLLIPNTRKVSAWGVVLMLIAFIPSHVYFIQIGSCVEGGICTPEWVGWLRLIVIHPLLLAWAWIYTKD